MFFLIMLSTVLFFFCLYLFLDNKIIKKQLEKLENELKTVLDKKIQNNVEDSISIDNISTDIIKYNNQEDEPTKREKITNIKEEQLEYPIDPLEKVPYIARNNHEEEIPKFKEPTSTNLAKEANSETIAKKEKLENTETIINDALEKTINSGVKQSIDKEVKTTLESVLLDEPSTLVEKTPIIPNITLTDDFDPVEFIKTKSSPTTEVEEKTEQKPKSIEEKSQIPIESEPLTSIITSKSHSDKVESKASVSSNDYLQELSNNLTDEIPPQTIELTGYEKIQEEQAVISYQELLSLKEKLKNQDKQDKQFIETLKEIRRLLDSNT